MNLSFINCELTYDEDLANFWTAFECFFLSCGEIAEKYLSLIIFRCRDNIKIIANDILMTFGEKKYFC